MDTMRLVLIVALCFVLYQIYQAWQHDYGQAAAPPAQELTSEEPLPAAVEEERIPEEEDIPEAPSSSISMDTEEPTVPSMKSGKRIGIKTDVFKLDIDTVGGDIRRVELLEYSVDVEDPDDPFVLMSDSAPRFFIGQGGLRSNQDAPNHHAVYTADQDYYELDGTRKSLQVTLKWEASDSLTVRKVYTFHRGSYLIDIHYEVENKGTEPWVGHLYQQLQRGRSYVTGGFIRTFTGVALSSPDKRYEKFDFDDLVDEPISRDAQGGWAAILQHYFFAALVPDQQTTYRYYSKALDDQRYVVGLIGPAQRIEPGGQAQLAMKMFAGPKKQRMLAKIAPNLDLTADYGVLWFLSKPLFLLLNGIQQVIGNWGLSIICVTIVVKLLFFRLSAASYRSMANMRRLQPRLVSIKERYGSDKARLNQAMMELYKKEKINPLGGCFPILVQIPVWIALYWVLIETVELRQAPFLFWIKDLSIPDPFFVLPVVMGIMLFAQQKLNPAPVDPIQQKVMQLFPVIFTVFTTMFAAGLVLYWCANSFLSILQQWYITRNIERAASAA